MALRFPVPARFVVMLAAQLMLTPPLGAELVVTPIDLGTIGGNVSRGRDINAAGTVVGQSGIRVQETHAFLWRAATQEMIDLGTLGGDYSKAVAIDADSNVFGESRNGDGELHAFVWDSDTEEMIDLGTLGGDWSNVTAVTPGGIVIGRSRTATGQYHGFLIEPVTVLGATFWYADYDADGINDYMLDLGTLGGSSSEPMAVDLDPGSGEPVVVGQSRTASSQDHAFLWSQASGMIDLGTLGGNSSCANDIRGGTIVGSSGTSGGQVHAFKWTAADRMVDLEINAALGDTWSSATLISGTGAIIGGFGTASHTATAFIWTSPASIERLPILDLDDEEERTLASDVNDSGRIAGWSGYTGAGASHGFHAVTWRPGYSMLNVGISLSDHDSSAVAVNNNAVVVGWVELESRRETHAFGFFPDLPGSLDLGTLGGDESRATDVNDSNDIVGYSNTEPDETHAFLHDGGFLDLGLLPETTSSEARGVGNRLEAVVGNSGPGAFIWWPTMNIDGDWNCRVGPTTTIPITFDQRGNDVTLHIYDGSLAGTLEGRDMVLKGSFVPVPGQSNTHIYKITARVVANGRTILADVYIAVGFAPSRIEPVRFTRRSAPSLLSVDAPVPGQLIEIPPLAGDPRIEAEAVNSLAEVVGTSGEEAFLWGPDGSSVAGMQGLGFLAGHEKSSGADIDDDARVVGTSWRVVSDGGGIFGCSYPTGHRAFLWTSSGDMENLGTLDFQDGSEAVAINNSDVVVGNSWDVVVTGGIFCDTHTRSNRRAFLWTPETGMMDLGTLAPGQGSEAIDVDPAGRVLGKSGGHYFLVVPEDSDGSGGPDTWMKDENEDDINDLMYDLGPLGSGAELLALNGDGWAAGSLRVSGDLHAHKWHIIASGPPDNDGDGYSATDGDCHDGSADTYPGAAEICDGLDNDCDETVDEGFDGDGDGYSPCLDDCNDTNAGVHPGATELCNYADDDCDGYVDEGLNEDWDWDGYSACQGDCDDFNGSINPGAPEACDGFDNNCNGNVDEGFDADQDGTADCFDECPEDPGKTEPGVCDCGVPDDDSDEDTVLDCEDNCSDDPNLDQEDTDQDGLGNVCDPTPLPEPSAERLWLAALVTVAALRRLRGSSQPLPDMHHR